MQPITGNVRPTIQAGRQKVGENEWALQRRLRGASLDRANVHFHHGLFAGAKGQTKMHHRKAQLTGRPGARRYPYPQTVCETKQFFILRTSENWSYWVFTWWDINLDQCHQVQMPDELLICGWQWLSFDEFCVPVCDGKPRSVLHTVGAFSNSRMVSFRKCVL